MEEWAELMREKTFITDLGSGRAVPVGDAEQTLGRYAAWSPLKGRDGHAIVEVSSDLDTLMARYRVPRDRVCALQTQS